MLDLYGKEKFKPGFSWWDCRTCGKSEYPHNTFDCQYNPLVLDELGDWWYYWRILCYQDDYTVWDVTKMAMQKRPQLVLLREMLRLSLNILDDYEDSGFINSDELSNAFRAMGDFLYTLEFSLDYLTKLNYKKLNSEPTNHGWKGA